MMELRCPHRKFGELDGLLLSVKCSSRLCGVAPEIIIMHWFDALTGELVRTRKFRDPSKEGRIHGSNGNSTSVWPA